MLCLLSLWRNILPNNRRLRICRVQNSYSRFSNTYISRKCRVFDRTFRNNERSAGVQGRSYEIVRIFTISAMALPVNKRPLSYDSRAVTGERRRRRLKTVTHAFIRQRHCPVRVDCLWSLFCTRCSLAANSSTATSSSSLQPMTHSAKTDTGKAPKRLRYAREANSASHCSRAPPSTLLAEQELGVKMAPVFRRPVCGLCVIDFRL